MVKDGDLQTQTYVPKNNHLVEHKILNEALYFVKHYHLYTVVSHIYAYDRAKTLSFILLIRRKRLNVRMNQMSKV